MILDKKPPNRDEFFITHTKPSHYKADYDTKPRIRDLNGELIPVGFATWDKLA